MLLVNKGSSVQRTHPLLYWMTIAYIVGVPNFLHFDGTGRTHEFGLFNFTSISRIALTLMTAYVLSINLAMGRGPIFPRKVDLPYAAWITLLIWCTVATVLQPQSRLSASLATDLPLSLFRLGEWVLAFVLLLALYTREPAEKGVALAVEIIGRVSWITIIMVWITFPFAPHLIYGSMDEPGSIAFLGGVFVNPGVLAFHANCAFFYSLLLFKRPYYRWLSCSLGVLTLVLTRARTPQIGFFVALGCYALVFSRKPALRWATIGIIFASAGVGATFSQPIAAYLTRGQDVASVVTLDNRVVLWQACWSAIERRPILGYGYVIGAKNAIRDYWLYSSQWIPPHAHNDVIQATLQAGFPVGLLVLYLYVWLISRSAKAARNGYEHLLIFLSAIQLAIIGVTGLVMAYTVSSLSAVFLLCCIGSARSRSGPQSLRGIREKMRPEEELVAF